MDWLCATCRRAKATRPRNAELCGSCRSWREAREKSRTLREALGAPRVDRDNQSKASAREGPAAPTTTERELLMLMELARTVGEDAAKILQRVLSATAKGSPWVYRSEWNRLMARFISRLETPFDS